MFKTTLSPDRSELRNLNQALQLAPQATQRFIRSTIIPQYQRLVQVTLGKTPGKPHYKLRWSSMRQMRFVMRKLRIEDNLPYHRTGRLQRSWVVAGQSLADGMDITIANTAPASEFVIGRFQQPFHKDTGWVYAPTEIRVLQLAISQDVAEFYFSIVGAARRARFV